ncbi:hypothetical protein CKAN_02026600 [Cinnamomum micranthum f. kanehirae]|uniref:Serine/threonine-protein phosphatase 7 long form n=1 Tax=Cinnamomum micranthum f. kanehirae TaxID=337451 RepID=A0A443PK47_9MAGN|nr:hypothetical protein CKAN_02026600 [Cinnamomum micranthum f. kanehirae]
MRVPVIYLSLLLAFHELGFVTRSVVKQISGYLTLLEAWIYEHFKLCKPTPNLRSWKTCLECIIGFPRGILEMLCLFIDTLKGS